MEEYLNETDSYPADSDAISCVLTIEYFSFQVYEGLVYMDFSQHICEAQGFGQFSIILMKSSTTLKNAVFLCVLWIGISACPEVLTLFISHLWVGNYSHIAVKELPTFWLAYLGDPSDSGKIHSDVNQRWKSG